MFNDAVSAVCKKCGKTAKSDEFVLDNEYGMMICPACVKDKRDRVRNMQKQAVDEAEKQKKQEEQKKKPAGWDQEDEYLEKYYKRQEKVKVERISEDKIKITCPTCKYQFPFNTNKQTPRNCPYCTTPVDLKSLKYATY